MKKVRKPSLRWHCLQHVPFETPGLLVQWATDRGHVLSVTHLWEHEPLPPADEYDGVFVLGGPMNVYDESLHPWLADEKAFLTKAVVSDKPILGICLGAQLLSIALGGEVTKAPCKEIGWFPVHRTPEGRQSRLFADFSDPLMAFHWHGDRFSIPPGATHIATSAACVEQAFVFKDRVVGLQFHLETDASGIAALIENCQDELVGGPYIQDIASIQGATEWMPEARDHLFKLLDRLTE